MAAPANTGLTFYLVALMKAPRERLVGADTTKLAAKYQIPERWAREYLEMWKASHE